MKATNFLFLLIIASTWTACDRGKDSAPLAPQQKAAIFEKDPDKRTDARLEWNRKTLVEAYQKVGSQSSAWDSAAEKLLEAFAQIRAGQASTGEIYNTARDSARAAFAAGCDDPMVAYLLARYAANETDGDPVTYAEKVSVIAENLNESGYPPLRRFYACLRAAEASIVNRGTNRQVSPRLAALRYGATTNLIDALSDMTTPVEEIYEAINQWLPTGKRSTRQFAEDMKLIEPALKRWPEVPLILLARAECAIDHAWNARGGGYADTVTPEGAKLFEQRLTDARGLLEKAWKGDPSESRVPTKMLAIAVGLGFPREEMEKWFDRAMKLDTNNYVACEAKLHYLKPQWYGSPEDMFQFGRECVASPIWAGRVPFTLLDAHTHIAAFLPAENKLPYWKNPAVWQDVRSSFEKYFALYPLDVGYRHNYAFYAFQADQWKSFNQQLALFSAGTNYNYFGGKERFEAMVREARERVSRK